MNTILKHSIFLFLFIIPYLSIAQDVSFEGTANAKQVIMGNHFQVSFTLKNANGRNFSPPNFKDFKRLSGQNTSSQSSNTNGQWETSTTYSFFLQPKKVGILQIGTAKIVVDGKTYQTQPFKIEVLKASPQQQEKNQEKKIFIQAEVNTQEAVPGQQIILDYKLYTFVNVDHYSITEEPSYSGFFTSMIRRFDNRQMNEVINGVQYSTKVLKRIALYPQQTGQVTIPPVKFRVAIPITGAARNNSPFSFLKPTESHIISSNSTKINISSLPSPIPPSFSGAVGNYQAVVSIDKKRVTTDDAITLRFTVAGDGDIKRVTAPELLLSDSFEVYDPNVIDEQQKEKNGELYGQKTFEYLILPKVPGQFTIDPAFSYFNPDSAKFVITRPNSYPLEVKKGQYNANVNVKPQKEEKATAAIRHIQTQFKTQQKSDFNGSTLFWILSTFPFFALAAGIAYRYHLANKPEIDMVAERSRKAQKVAKQRLAVAEKHLKTEDYKAFYHETSKVLLGYAVDKYNIPGSALTKNNVQEKLSTSGAQETHIERFIDLLKTCEQAVFAFGTNADASLIYEDAMKIIVDIEEVV